MSGSTGLFSSSSGMAGAGRSSARAMTVNWEWRLPMSALDACSSR